MTAAACGYEAVMRILFLLVIVIGVLVAVAYLAAKPALEKRASSRNRSEEQPTLEHGAGTVGRTPPPDPEPGEAANTAGNDVPPGSRPDRERHGKL